MTPTEASRQLTRVFDAFPSYREYVAKTKTPERTEDAWVAMITPCHLADTVAVVDRIVAGTLEGHERYQSRDQLPVNIRREANQLRSERQSKKEQFEQYHNQSKGAWDWVAKNATGRIAITLGVMVRDGKITREDNDVRIQELIAWDKGGDTPDWLPELNKR